MTTRRALLGAALAAAPPLIAPRRAGGAATPVPSPDNGGDYARPEWLVDPAWLAARSDDRSLTVVALTPPDEFVTAHVPGAVALDWPDLELVDTSGPSVARWRDDVAATLTHLGVAHDNTAVVYDGGTLFAARLWWVLDQLGHADVRILDGGLPAWIAAGQPVATGAAAPVSAPEPHAGKARPETLATLEEVRAALGDPDVALVDARTPEEYAAGHIPGAVNVDFPRNARTEQPKTWKPAAELRALYEDLGVTPDKRVIPYCQTGVRSAVTYFTLRLIGYDRVSLYTGSWEEWGAHPDTPKATA